MPSLIIPTYLEHDEDTTNIKTVIEEHYDLGKHVSYQIWANPRDYQGFEDLYHTSLYNVIKCLDGKKMPKKEIINYFFRSFRVNLIRLHNYSYRKLCDDIDIEGMLIPIDNETKNQSHLDGWGMIDLVKRVYGDNIAEALLSELSGFTINTICKKYNVTYYQLCKVKQFLINYYKDDKYKLEGNIWIEN